PAGHVVSALLRNLLSGVILIAAGYGTGFRPSATLTDCLEVTGIFVLFVIAWSCVAVLLGLLASSVEGASGLSMILVFLPYRRSGWVPTSTVPRAWRGIIANQRVSPVITAIRALLTGGSVGHAAWLAAGWWLGILILAIPCAAILFQRRAAG